MLLPKVQQYTLENTEGTINNGESRETGNITRRRQANKNTTQYVSYTTTRKVQVRHDSV